MLSTGGLQLAIFRSE